MTIPNSPKVPRLEQFMKRRLFPWVFGDLRGLGIFLGAILFFGAYWRIGFFITDNWTLANTLVGLSNGHFHVGELVYGPYTGNTPGMHIVNNQLYGRNYGQLILSLPFVWFLEATTLVTDFRILLAALYSLVILGFSWTIGQIRTQHTTLAALGSVTALGVFAVNVHFATALDAMWLHQTALQLATLIAASYLGVVTYRLGTWTATPRIGVFLAGTILLATPIGFWASIPKRHIFTTLLALITLLAVAKSRTTHATFPPVYYRAIAYGMVGISAWIHAAEALVLLLVLLPVDLATAPSNSRRELGIIAGAFGVSLIPFFLTNYLVIGNPLEPPRLWPPYDGQPLNQTTNPVSPTDPRAGGPGNTLSVIISLVFSVPGYLDRLFSFITAGVTLSVTEPHRLYYTFIRSGWIEGVTLSKEGAVNLTILESAPVLGILAALPALAYQKLSVQRPRLALLTSLSPTRTIDLFTATYVIILTLMYLPRLPLHAMVTVRYLLPVFPFLCYAAIRLPVTRDVLENDSNLLAWTYIGLVLIGSQLLLVILFTLDLNPEEAMQLHAHIGLIMAFITGSWAITATLTDKYHARIGAIVLATTLATGTIFLLFTAFDYTTYGNFALAIGDLLNRLISIT